MSRDDATLTYKLTGSHEYRVSPDGTLSLSHPTERLTRVYESARRLLETLVEIAREPSSIFTILYSKGNREERRQRQIEERHRRGTHGINKKSTQYLRPGPKPKKDNGSPTRDQRPQDSEQYERALREHERRVAQQEDALERIRNNLAWTRYQSWNGYSPLPEPRKIAINESIRAERPDLFEHIPPPTPPFQDKLRRSHEYLEGLRREAKEREREEQIRNTPREHIPDTGSTRILSPDQVHNLKHLARLSFNPKLNRRPEQFRKNKQPPQNPLYKEWWAN